MLLLMLFKQKCSKAAFGNMLLCEVIKYAEFKMPFFGGGGVSSQRRWVVKLWSPTCKNVNMCMGKVCYVCRYVTISGLIVICGALWERASYIQSYSVRWEGKHAIWLCYFSHVYQGKISPEVLTQSFHFPSLLGISMVPFLICLILPSGKLWV